MVFSSHTFAFRRQLGPANSGGFHEKVPRYVPDGDWQSFVWYEHADKMVDELRLHRTSTHRHREPVAIDQTVMKATSKQLQADLCDAAATDCS